MTEPIQIEATDWGAYARDPAFRQQIDLRAAVALDLDPSDRSGPASPVVIGSGVGLIQSPAGAPAGSVLYWGLKGTSRLVAFARQCTAKQKLSQVARSGSSTNPIRGSLPLDDGGQADLVLIFDQLERHPNPVGLLNEVIGVCSSPASP